MIPQFPEFKKLELSDKEDVEKFTSKYPPYADHNFLGTWSWDVHEKIYISQLNGNYVIRFADYSTGEPFYTFLGENMVNETAKALLDISKKKGITQELKLIPEISIKGLDTNIFKIEEDRDNFDYVYDLEELKNYKGGKFESKRRETSNFSKKYSNAEVSVLDLKSIKTQEEITRLYGKWSEYKVDKEPDFNPALELITLKKFFSGSSKFNLVTMGIFIENELVAFRIDELKESEYAVSHVAKADTSLFGLYAFLMQKSAEILYSHGKKYLDYEQDLGFENLRYSKESFRPSFFLKKYIITAK